MPAKKRKRRVKVRRRYPSRLSYTDRLERLDITYVVPFRARVRLKPWQKAWITKEYRKHGRTATYYYRKEVAAETERRIEEELKVVEKPPRIEIEIHPFSVKADVSQQPLYKIVDYAWRLHQKGKVMMFTYESKYMRKDGTVVEQVSTTWMDFTGQTKDELEDFIGSLFERGQITGMRHMKMPR